MCSERMWSSGAAQYYYLYVDIIFSSSPPQSDECRMTAVLIPSRGDASIDRGDSSHVMSDSASRAAIIGVHVKCTVCP